jgi:hypothetical protein
MRAAAAAAVTATSLVLWISPVLAQSGESTPNDPAPAETTEPPADEDRADEADDEASLVEEDVQPTVPVVKTGDVEVRVGGLIQVHAAPYVGDAALIENGDPATHEGFRLRRSRLGVESRFSEPLRMYLTIDLLEADEDDGTISDAKILYDWSDYARFSAGVGKVPFARGQLESSRSLDSIERPLSVDEISPDHRVGVSIEGQVADRVSYLTGLFNGTEGLADGNEYGGFLTGARLQVTLLGKARGLGVEDGVAVGASGFYEDAPSTNGFAVSGDVLVSMAGVGLTVEGLCDRRTPDDAPDISPTLSDEITRCGGYAGLTYDVAPDLLLAPIQPAVRVELYDDNTAVDDAGDVWLISGGVNTQLMDRYLRGQLHYIRRVERHGVGRPNDSVILSLVGSF